MKNWDFLSSQEVAFHDCDPMHVVWHGNYLKYMEIARTQFLYSLGISLKDLQESGYYFPIVDVKLRYTRPLTLDNKFDVQIKVKEYENRLVLEYEIVCDNQKCVTGSTTQVTIRQDNKALEFFTPNFILNAIKDFIEQKKLS